MRKRFVWPSYGLRYLEGGVEEGKSVPVALAAAVQPKPDSSPSSALGVAATKPDSSPSYAGYRSRFVCLRQPGALAAAVRPEPDSYAFVCLRCNGEADSSPFTSALRWSNRICFRHLPPLGGLEHEGPSYPFVDLNLPCTEWPSHAFTSCGAVDLARGRHTNLLHASLLRVEEGKFVSFT